MLRVNNFAAERGRSCICSSAQWRPRTPKIPPFRGGLSSARSAVPECEVLDLNLPPNAARLAAACFVHGISAPELMKMSAEHCATFAAAAAGLSFSDFLAAIDWLSDFHETHPPLGVRPN
jgi:hypothetical protein